MTGLGAQCPARPGTHQFEEQLPSKDEALRHWATFVCWDCGTIVKVSLKEKREASLGS